MDHSNQSGVSPSNLEPMVLEDGRGGGFASSANTSKATRIMANFGGSANAKKVWLSKKELSFTSLSRIISFYVGLHELRWLWNGIASKFRFYFVNIRWKIFILEKNLYLPNMPPAFQIGFTRSSSFHKSHWQAISRKCWSFEEKIKMNNAYIFTSANPDRCPRWRCLPRLPAYQRVHPPCGGGPCGSVLQGENHC